jgi:hypothetical protein
VQAANRAIDKACKKKKDVEKAKIEAREHTKLQSGKHRRGLDEEETEDDDDDDKINEQEE